MATKPAKKFVLDLKKDLRDRGALRNSLRFLVIFALSFSVFMYFIIPATAGFWDSLGIFHAQATQGILSSFGVPSTVAKNILTMDVSGSPVDFEISRLCSGDIEIALLGALLLASFDVLFVWRAIGILIGSGLLILMNPVRISVTLLITRDSGMDAGDFYHTIIFRLFLFVLLVLYYFAWYRFFVKRKSRTQDKICKKLKKIWTAAVQ
jgi:exosortase/archaeosortase family protein